MIDSDFLVSEVNAAELTVSVITKILNMIPYSPMKNTYCVK